VQRIEPYRTIQILTVAIGLFIGAWHLLFAVDATFVFLDTEPWTSWVAIALGPCVTLPLVILSLFHTRTGAIALIVAAIAALGAFILANHQHFDALRAFVLRVTLPVVVVGVVLLVVTRSQHSEDSHARGELAP
jgi:hypothetical protein